MWSPLEAVMALHSHCERRVSLRRDAGGETEPGGCCGQDTRTPPSQGMEGAVVLKLGSGPGCVLLSGEGGQGIVVLRKATGVEQNDHDNETVSHRLLSINQPGGLSPTVRRIHCVSTWSARRRRS